MAGQPRRRRWWDRGDPAQRRHVALRAGDALGLCRPLPSGRRPERGEVQQPRVRLDGDLRHGRHRDHHDRLRGRGAAVDLHHEARGRGGRLAAPHALAARARSAADAAHAAVCGGPRGAATVHRPHPACGVERLMSPAAAIAVPVIAAAALAFDGGAAVPPAAETCTRVYAYHPVETPLKVSSDLTVRLRSPYGPKVNVGRFFVSFRIVYASAADRAKVSAVQWTLDGAPVRNNRGGRDAYLFGSFHLTPGPHVISATITPVGGTPPVTGELRFTATGCAPLGFGAGADNRRQPGAQPTAFWVYTGTTPIGHVALGGRATVVSTAPRLRGRKVGELRYVTGTRVVVKALRLPRRWSDAQAIPLLRDGRLRVQLNPNA